MRTVGGRTDHVVVVGAGLAGLAAALHLAGRGRAVTVVERGDVPGGRVGRLDVDGYRLDTGPTVLTMPDMIDDTFAAVGESTADRLELTPVDPAYRASFADGSTLDVHSDRDAMAAEVARVRRAATRRRATYGCATGSPGCIEVEFDGFIASNFDSPLSLLTPQLARLAALGGFRRWDRVVRRFITDERLRRIFTFQALYAGVPPQRALAVYAVIAYMDTVAGVYFPRGGMRALPDALAAAAADAGVEFRYGATVSGLDRQRRPGHRRVTPTAVSASTADAVVLTTELPDTYRLLGRTPAPAAAAAAVTVGGRRAPRLPTVDARDRRTTHILFGDAWDQTFRDIIDDGRVMRDPSLLVTRPTAGDPSLAPTGPRPAVRPGARAESGCGARSIGTDIGARLRRQHARRRHRPAARSSAPMPRSCTSSTPRTGRARACSAGTPFALAHTFAPDGAVPPGQHRPRASTTWCWPARRPCRASACRPHCCRDGWPPTGSPAAVAPAAPRAAHRERARP